MQISPNYCLVTQRIIAITADSDSDEDRMPDQQTVSGNVYFTPNVASGRAYQLRDEEGNSFTVPLGRVEASIVDGEIVHEGQRGISLFAAGQGSNPSKISYFVEYRNLRAGTTAISLSPMNFEAVPGGEVDLTAATPVTGATPPGTTKGDKGDPFLYEDFTPEQLEALKGEPGEVTFEQLNQAIRVDTTVGTRAFAGDTMIYGNTGVRSVSDLGGNGLVFEPSQGFSAYLSRDGHTVTFWGIGLATGYLGVTEILPLGFKPLQRGVVGSASAVGETYLVEHQGRNELAFMYNKPPQKDSLLTVSATWTTHDPWPTSLPGTPA